MAEKQKPNKLFAYALAASLAFPCNLMQKVPVQNHFKQKHIIESTMPGRIHEKKEEKQILSEEQQFKEEKTKFYKSISDYYGIDATTNNEIRERLSYLKQALDDFDLGTFRIIKEKISLPKDAKTDNLFMIQISFAAYYPFWLFFGPKNAVEMVKKPEFPDILITEDKKLNGVYENTNESGLKKGQIVLSDFKGEYIFYKQTNPVLLFNFIMHETIHSLGYLTEDAEKNTWNEFAIGLCLPFSLPIQEKESKTYSDFYFGFRNPFHILKKEKNALTLKTGRRKKMQILQKTFSKNNAIKEYNESEYLELFFANLLFYKLDRKEHLDFIRKQIKEGKTLKKMITSSYQVSIFDMVLSFAPSSFEKKDLKSLIQLLKSLGEEDRMVKNAINSVNAFELFFALFDEYYVKKGLNTSEYIKMQKLKTELNKILFSILLNNEPENKRKEMKNLKNLLKKMEIDLIPKNMENYVFKEKGYEKTV